MGTIVRPSADLRNHYNEISMQSEQELLHILTEAEDDVINGRVELMQQTFDDIKSRLKES